MSTPYSPVRMSMDELHLMWAWVQGCCVSLYGDERGREEAKRVPVRVSIALWQRQLVFSPEGWS
jgi:hypothetical protein